MMMMKFSVWMILVLLSGLSSSWVLLAAQTPADKSATQTVTGCLQKGMENKGFFVIAANGQHWELYPQNNVVLADQVGKKVMVTGTVAKRSPEQEEKSQPYEKKEITGTKHADLRVFNMKVVSDTCQ
jgi:hypothetical protein